MDKRSKGPFGSTTTPFMSTAGEEKTAWKLPSGTNMHHSSTDASLFSASLPVLSHVKLNINESDQSDQSLDNGFPRLDKLCLEDEVKDLLEEDTTDPSVIGNFLPGDEDELLAGLMDDFDLGGLPTQLEELDDDIFGSGGGLEIEQENQENLITVSRISTSDIINGSSLSHYGFVNGMGTISGEHPYGEHPSRTLFVRNINSNVEDSELRSLFEQYGDIRTLYTACKHRGFVMISYYDIRAARTAMRVLQSKPLRRRKLDIHFSIPKDNPSEKDINQGTLVVFNLDPSVSNDDLRQIFGGYGEVKEIRETPHKRHHKFVEFYDVRAAEAALKALNRSDIAGKRIKLEPSRPGGARRSLMLQLTQEQEQDEARNLHQQVGSPVAISPPGGWPHYSSPMDQDSLHGYMQPTNMGQLSPVGSSHVPGLASILPSHASSPVKIAPIGKDLSRMSPVSKVIPADNATHGASYRKHLFTTDSKLSSSLGPVAFGDSKSSSVGTLSGPQFLWGSPTIHSEYVNSSAWSPSLKGHPFSPTRQGIRFPYSSHHETYLGSHHHHHVGSAPSGIQLERHFGFFPESPESSSYIKHAFGISNFSHNNGNLAMNIGLPESMKMGVAFAGNITESGSPRSRIMPISRNSPMYFGNGSFGGMGDGIMDRGRSRRADCVSQMDNKRQYQLDLEKIMNGEDSRTTLMIKNIPNKYTSKMLLVAIDETHKGTYDFLYLPIDFKNKCNVGYAFINMVSPSHIITFYEAFNGKRWEKFNSEKVASLAFARIQGKPALISHFQNSSLMNEDKRCRPIVFQSEGHEAGDLEHVPSGNLNVFILRPDGSYAGDSLDSPKGDGKL